MFLFEQNNSGGYFKGNLENVLVINADDREHAISLFDNNTPAEIVFDDPEFCECCGSRWYVSQNQSWIAYNLQNGAVDLVIDAHNPQPTTHTI